MRMATSPNPFIQAYLNRGFGSMTKTDFEVMIFAELLQTSLLKKSNYEISIDLRIPESHLGERLIDIGADSILNFIQNTNF